MNNAIQLQVNNQIITGADIFDAVDGVLDNLRETGDLLPAQTALRTLFAMQELSGQALAKLLYGVSAWYNENRMEEQTEDTFEDWFYTEVSTIVKPITIERYISVWDKHEQGLFTDAIKERPLKDQIAIAKAIEQGYPIDDKYMKELERAENYSEVGAILREVKGIEPRKSALQIYLERDGSLNAWQDGEKHFVGYLNIKENEDDVVKKAVTRITDAAGLRKR